MKTKKKPYEERTDAERLEDNWNKTVSLFNKSQYSMAVVRAGTCVEIAANIVIRAELVQKRKLEAAFVDSLLVWANGLHGKLTKLILPLFEGSPQIAKFKKHKTAIEKLNKTRNAIAHGGHFTSQTEAETLLTLAHLLCGALTTGYPAPHKLKKL